MGQIPGTTQQSNGGKASMLSLNCSQLRILTDNFQISFAGHEFLLWIN